MSTTRKTKVRRNKGRRHKARSAEPSFPHHANNCGKHNTVSTTNRAAVVAAALTAGLLVTGGATVGAIGAGGQTVSPQTASDHRAASDGTAKSQLPTLTGLETPVRGGDGSALATCGSGTVDAAQRCGPGPVEVLGLIRRSAAGWSDGSGIGAGDPNARIGFDSNTAASAPVDGNGATLRPATKGPLLVGLATGSMPGD